MPIKERRRSIRFLQWLIDTLVTATVFAAGVASLVAAGRARDLLSWDALGLAFGALLAFIVVAGRLPASLGRSRQRPTVDSIQSGRVELTEGWGGPDRRALRALGGRRDFLAPWVWTFAVPDDRALASLLGALRDLGVVFVGIDRGWSPGDVFEDLREQGLVHGPFEEIVWQGPGMSQVRKR